VSGRPVRVDVRCKKCGQRQRLDIGLPAGADLATHRQLLTERLSHQPSFQCFGGHFELRPAIPEFWEIDWETVGD
jgi:hypothetical protein